MKFKTKVAYSAVLATLGMVAGTAQAAYLSEQGTGQVLFYPYYTVQDGMETYISVVNTTNTTKAVKVRFIEGKASAEVLDFNLYLSPKDVWNAAIVASGTAATDPAKVVTGDKSCTVPAIPAAGQNFRNAQYATKDQNGDGLDRTREGYVEIIEMGEVTGTIGTSTSKNLKWATTHVNGVLPVGGCDWVANEWVGESISTPTTKSTLALGAAPGGGLIGAAALVNPKAGVDYSYDPVAIEDYSTSTALHFAPGSLLPSMQNADPVSAIINGTGTARRMITTDWTGVSPLTTLEGVDAVSTVLMRSNVLNEYTVNNDLAAATDWVVTFPTKRFYVPVNSASVYRPFTTAAALKTAPWGSCEDVELSVYDREEQKKGGSIDFSPSTGATPCLKWESNVISFGTKNVLASANLKLALENVYADGWVDMRFIGANALTGMGAGSASTTWAAAVGTATATTTTYVGLPTIGFSVQKYVNSTFNGAVGNYGGAYIHKYIRTVKSGQ